MLTTEEIASVKCGKCSRQLVVDDWSQFLVCPKSGDKKLPLWLAIRLIVRSREKKK